MARYGVNVSAAKPQAAKQELTPTIAEGPAPEPKRTAVLVTLYAVAVAITPEFNFLGIPKVRFTDLLVPFLIASFGSRLVAQVNQQGKKSSKFSSQCMQLLFWNFGALLLWGQAKLDPGVLYLAKRAEYFLVALLCSASVGSVFAWNRVIRTLVFASPILNCSVLLEMFAFNTLGDADAENIRASGIIANQQTSTALFIVIICCISLGAWDAYKDKLWRLGTSMALLTGVGAIFATGSRGGLACAVLSLLIILILRPGKLFSLGLIGLGVGFVAWAMTPDALQGRLAGILPETQATLAGLGDSELMPDSGSSSIAGRAETAQHFFKDLLPRCGLLGLGAGWKRLGAIDNFYLSEWLYHGFIGLCLFIRLQWTLVLYCLQATRKSQDKVEAGVATGVAAAVIVMSASGVHADTFYLIRPMECLALLVGLVMARAHIRAREEKPKPILAFRQRTKPAGNP